MSLTDRSEQPYSTVKKSEGSVATSFHSRHLDIRDKNARSTVREHFKDVDEENDVALTLVSRAATTIEVLQSRCAQLELAATELRDRLKSEAETADRVIKDWETLATAMKAQLHDSEQRIGEIQQKLEISEARAQAEEVRAEVAEQHAGMEEEIASSLRDKIIAALGTTTQVQPVVGQLVNHQS